MNQAQKNAISRGWVEAAPGYWAWGAWRIQRLTRGWAWGYVVAGGPRGRARTMNAAMDAVEAACKE